MRVTLFDFLALTKPRTIHLVVGAIPAMLLATRGVLAPLLMVNMLIGTVLMTAGANTLNCVADADIDKLMKRTANRPLARGAVSTRYALVFGLALSGGALLWLSWTTTVLAGLLALATIAFYVLVYTMLIKRRSSHNVVWGGVANGMPVLIGWSAVTGTIGWQAVLMIMIVFFWTPPHSWALAMRHNDDYRAAGVPMLPAVATQRRVATRILIYTWLTALATLLLGLATGWLYDVVGLLAAAWPIWQWCSARWRSILHWHCRRRWRTDS
jgi:heme o synthase